MVPSFITVNDAYWAVLPPGVHAADMTEVKKHFAYNQWRRQLYDGLQKACVSLVAAGCRSLYLDGSFVSEKPKLGISMLAGSLMALICVYWTPFF